MIIRIKDVAKRAGVSSATVSRVLANKDVVKLATREKVLKAVAELGYKPSRVARSLRVKSSQIIGLIISDIQNPFFTSLVRAVEDLAHKNNYALFLCNSDESLEKETLYVDLMLAERVAGVIIAPTDEQTNPCKRLLDANVPLVSIDRRILDCNVDTVLVDNVLGAYKLTEHLIVNGHTRIGAILGAPHITTGRERLEGYKQALNANDLLFDWTLVRMGMPKIEVGKRFTRELLNMPIPPTAIFTGNNLLTIGALGEINECRMRIPHDIALAGFDDPDWARLVNPRLTAVAQPTYELGRQAANLILKRISNPDRPPELIILEPTIMYRESSAFHHSND
jgi:DNA-binding LacI/PurR family transcriptional regulator